MNTFFKVLLKDKIIAVSFWTSVVFFVLTLLVVALTYGNLPPYLPLYNKLAWGYARLGQTYEIAVPILIPILFFIGNMFFAKNLYDKSPLLSRFLAFVSLLVALFTFIFIMKLTLIVL